MVGIGEVCGEEKSKGLEKIENLMDNFNEGVEISHFYHFLSF